MGLFRTNESDMWSGNHRIIISMMQSGEHLWSCWTCHEFGRVWLDIFGPHETHKAFVPGDTITPAYRCIYTAVEQSHSARMERGDRS